MWDKGTCRDNGEICQHSLVLLWFDLAHLVPQVLFTKCVQFLDLELKNPKKCDPWAKSLLELTLYLFETELGGSPESKSIPSVFRHITETFFWGIYNHWGEMGNSHRHFRFQKSSTAFQRCLAPSISCGGCWGTWALCSIK